MKELYQEPNKALAYIQELYSEDQSNKRELIRLWERNAAFANGNQNFLGQFSNTAQVTATNFLISPYQDNRSQMFITNEIEPIVRTLVSYMTRVRPTVEIFPSDSSEERREKAKVGERVIHAKYDLDNESQISKKAAYYAFTFGTVFRKDYWDNSLGRDAELPVYDENGNEVIGEDGKVQMRMSKTGDSNVAILPPFLLSFDWSYPDFESLPCIIESYLMPIEWIRECYDRNEKGYTGKASLVTDDVPVGTSVSTWEQMKYATPFSYGASRPTSKGKALVQEVYIRPNYEYPKGRMMVIAGSQVVYDSGTDGSPYFMACRPTMWHPYEAFSYSPYIGRLLGKSLVESLIPQQMRLNEINGAIIHNANTLAKVDVLAVENQLKRGVMNGMGGNIYTYRMIPNAPPPQKWQGAPLPQQFFQEKQDLIEQMVREVGTNFIMSGNPPKGVTAASAIEQLLDNANTQQSDMMISWENFHERGYTKKLRVIRNFNKLPNEDIVDYLKTMSKDNLDLEIANFIGEDVGDGWNLRVEAGSMIPKSEKAKRDLYMTLSKEGLLGPVGEDSPRGARLRKELLAKFGEKGFDIEESADVEKQEWENTRMLNGLPVEVWEEDNDPIHISVIVSKMKDPKFLERATDEVKQAYQDHLSQHKESMRIKQMQSAPPVPQEQAEPVGGPQDAVAQGEPRLVS